MNPQARIAQINNTLQALQQGWPFFVAELQQRIDALTMQLISQDSEQVRGRIKQLCDLQDMPELLSQERDGISAGLAEQAPED